MRRRLLVLLAAASTCLVTALVSVPLTHADAASDRQGVYPYKIYTMCDVDADGKLCVEEAFRGPDAIRSGEVPSTVGSHEWFYVDNSFRYGNFGFNLNTKIIPPSGPVEDSKSVDASVMWNIKVNTGSWVPRELNSKTQDTEFTRGGNLTDGYWFRIKFRPVPIAWRWADGPYGCDMSYCGTNDTVAEFVSEPGEGFADGYVTDLEASDVSDRYVPARTGFFLASNAQYQAEPYYDAETNSIVVEMANPHLRAPGDPATGSFEAFLPNAYLISQLGVPDPTALKTGSFVITKTVGATTSTATYSAVAEPGGVSLKISTVSFSRPRYRITPKPKPPGKPRLTSVTKLTGAARSAFLPPLANGGKKIDLYQARCHKAGGTWKYKFGTSSPITVTSLPSGTVYCQVRAHNAIGWGEFGKAGASRAG